MSTPSTTQWTPPSITWPTTPYTLPADYGTGGPVCTAPPSTRPTYPPDADLPSMQWTIDDTLTVAFDPPDEFQADPIPPPPVGDCDRANGLYLLERWFVPDPPEIVGMSVSANPGPDSPLLSRTEFSDSIVGSNVTFYLWNGETVRQTGKSPNTGLAILGNYMFQIGGSPEAMRAIVENLTIEMTP
jgi:hypothetical protein